MSVKSPTRAIAASLTLSSLLWQRWPLTLGTSINLRSISPWKSRPCWREHADPYTELTLFTEDRRTATPDRHRFSGGQDCSTASGDHPQPDTRGGLPGLLVWASAGTQPAPGTRCPGRGYPNEAGELDSRCGHSELLRPNEFRMDRKICRAPSG